MSASILPLPSVVDSDLIDGRIIAELRECLGERVLGSILSDAVLETTERLTLLEDALTSRDMATIARLAHDLVGTPGQIGMVRLSSVSMNLVECVANSEWTTIRAVADRLLRIGQETLAIFPTEMR